MKLSGLSSALAVRVFAVALCVGVCSQSFAAGEISLTCKNLKILYHRHEKAEVEVALKNNTDRQWKDLSVVATVEKDVEGSSVIFREATDLGPGAEKELVVSWNVGDEEFGRELRIAIYSGSQLIASGTEYFSVADNLWKVAITGAVVGYLEPNLEKIENLDDYLEIKMESARKRFINWIEYYAWAPDDFFNLTPTRERWWSATGPYRIRKEHIQKVIEAAHRHGIRSVTYAQPFATGWTTFEMLRKHPEMFAYTSAGQPAPAYGTTFSTVAYDILRTHDMSRNLREEMPRYPPNSVFLNLADLKVVNRGIDEIIASQKMFGWDGVRWDNGFYVVRANLYDFRGKPLSSYGDAEELTARNERLIKKRFWSEISPNFVIGHNSGISAMQRHPMGFKEITSDGELFMSEGPRSFWQRDRAENVWSKYRDFITHEGDVGRKNGSHYLVIGLDNQYLIDQLYLQILTFASGAHPYSYQYRLGDRSLPGEYGKFITRYSCLMWDIERLSPLENPESTFDVDASRPLWWKRFARKRRLGEKHYQLVLHLINPPAQERIYSDDRPLKESAPKYQKDVTVRCRPGGRNRVDKVWLLTAEPRLKRERIDFTRQGDEIVVTVPELRYWSVLVYDVHGDSAIPFATEIQ